MTAEPKALHAWSGDFGAAYTARNAVSEAAVAGRARVWGEVLSRLKGAPPKSILEVGPNAGLNLRGLAALGEFDFWAMEPQPAAREILLRDKVLPENQLFAGFGHDLSQVADGAVDMAFTSGVLIHVDPSLLERTLREIHRVSSKYVFAAEYFSPKPETIPYRGETDLLFKNDFGGLYMDMFPDLELVDYGFFWRRTTVMDDSTWWLFRKTR